MILFFKNILILGLQHVDFLEGLNVDFAPSKTLQDFIHAVNHSNDMEITGP